MNETIRIARRLIRQVVTLPISPRAFRAFVTVLRTLRILPRPSHGSTEGVKSIFVAHPYSSVGDMVLLLPLLERIRNEWPKADIDIVVGSNACDLLAGVDGIRHRFVCGSHQTQLPILGNYLRLFRHLALYRKEVMGFEYDLAIAPRWGVIDTWQAVYFAYLTGAPQRIGYSATVDGGDCSLDLLLTKAAVGGGGDHESERNLKLLSRCGLAEDRVGDEAVVNQPIRSLQIMARMESASPIEMLTDMPSTLSSEKYAVVSPGATAKFRAWPVESLAEVIEDLYQRTGLTFYIIGSRSDERLCENLTCRIPACAKTLAGKTSIRQLVHLISLAQLFIGMDSGTAHIAGAIGTPSIVISPFPFNCKADHPNSPRRFRPCGPNVVVLQPQNALPPCNPTCTLPGPHCISQIEALDVVRAAVDLLDHKGAFTGSE